MAATIYARKRMSVRTKKGLVKFQPREEVTIKFDAVTKKRLFSQGCITTDAPGNTEPKGEDKKDPITKKGATETK